MPSRILSLSGGVRLDRFAPSAQVRVSSKHNRAGAALWPLGGTGKSIGDDYMEVDAGVEVLDKTTVLGRFSNPALEFDRHEVSDIQVKLIDTVGLIFGTVSLHGRFAGKVFEGRFRFIDVCVNRSGQWEIVASQLIPTSNGQGR
jgi:hypothetical protein